MDPRVKALKTVEECERLAVNAIRLGHKHIAEECRRRAVEIRAEIYGAETAAEKECLQAVYAYEEVLSEKNGKRTPAARTWQMIKRHGVLEAAERAVNRPQETAGYTALIEMGLQEFAFEAVILRYPDVFSEEAVSKSQERMQAWVDETKG